MNNIQAKKNYQLVLEDIIRKIREEGRAPTLLLHSCCGPCSSYVVSFLREYFDITVFYYNPNIYPETEYSHRLKEQARLLAILNVPLIEGEYDHGEFLDYVKGLEKEPEGGARCEKCFALRLSKTYALAREKGFEYFCTTLTVSPHKNAMVINRVGEEIAFCLPPVKSCEATEISPDREGAGRFWPVDVGEAEISPDPAGSGVLWLPSDFKKRDGYKKSIELSRQYELYRQEYCGCEFAIPTEQA